MRGGNVSLTGNQLRWLAGLLEGEGTFLVGGHRAPNQPSIQIGMVDYDIIGRVADIFGVGVNRLVLEGDLQPRYRTRLFGGAAVSLMKLLHSLMSERRRAQIDTAIGCYKPMLKFPHRTFQIIGDEMEEYERYWLAGYLEGEGYFGVQKITRRYGSYIYPSVGVDSTDEDVIVRVQRLWKERYGAGISMMSFEPSGGVKTAYRVRVRYAKARAIMCDLYPLLSERRQAKIRQILAEDS